MINRLVQLHAQTWQRKSHRVHRERATTPNDKRIGVPVRTKYGTRSTRTTTVGSLQGYTSYSVSRSTAELQRQSKCLLCETLLAGDLPGRGGTITSQQNALLFFHQQGFPGHTWHLQRAALRSKRMQRVLPLRQATEFLAKRPALAALVKGAAVRMACCASARCAQLRAA